MTRQPRPRPTGFTCCCGGGLVPIPRSRLYLDSTPRPIFRCLGCARRFELMDKGSQRWVEHLPPALYTPPDRSRDEEEVIVPCPS